MATETKRLTAEEYWRSIDQYRWTELVQGEVRAVSPANDEHSVIAALLTTELTLYTRQHGGMVAVEGGFLLLRNPDTVRGPDVAYIRRERLVGKRWGKFWEGAPDLAVEIVSPSNTLKDIQEKIQEYLQAGARLVWVVRPRSRSVVAHYPDGRTRVYRGDDILDGGDVLPGFTRPLREIFRLPGA